LALRPGFNIKTNSGIRQFGTAKNDRAIILAAISVSHQLHLVSDLLGHLPYYKPSVVGSVDHSLFNYHCNVVCILVVDGTDHEGVAWRSAVSFGLNPSWQQKSRTLQIHKVFPAMQAKTFPTILA